MRGDHQTRGLSGAKPHVSGRNFVCWAGCGGPDTGCVSVGALVQQVGEVLGRAHSLFGDPPASGGAGGVGCRFGFGGRGGSVRGGQRQMSGLSGALPVKYGGFATDAGVALDGAAGTDSRLSGQLHDAAGADRSGRASSGAVVNGAATDTASVAPLSGTPAGQRALISRAAGPRRTTTASRQRLQSP